jgi:hypothetical protein
MATMERNEVGHYHGVNYRLRYARINDVLVIERCSRVWHLWIENEYVGHFDLKRDAEAHVRFEAGVLLG